MATAAFFSRVVFSSSVFLERDQLLVYLPLKHYWAQRILRGELPDWYPYDGLGQPFVGMMVSGALHPLNLLYLWLPLTTAGDLNILICFPIAFVGCFVLARRFGMSEMAAGLVAILFAFNGYSISITNNVGYLMAAATVPWALWAMDRVFCRPSLLRTTVAALILTLILFAGDPESFFVSASLSLALLAFRFDRPRARGQVVALAALGGLTALFAAPQLVAGLHVTRNAAAGARTLHNATLWSLHPLRLFELAVGPVFDVRIQGHLRELADTKLLGGVPQGVWTNSIHLGAPALILAGFGLWVHRRKRAAWALFACAIAFVLLAMGRFGGLYAVVFKLVPPWRPFRYPAKLTPYLELALALGAGFGAQAAVSEWKRAVKASRALGVAAGIAGLLWVIERAWAPSAAYVGWAFAHSPDSHRIAALVHPLLLQGLAWTALALLACGLALLLQNRTPLVLPLLAAILFSYLWISNEPIYQPGLRAVVDAKSSFLRAIQDDVRGGKLQGVRIFSTQQRFRVPSIRDASLGEVDSLAYAYMLSPDLPALWGISSFFPYLPAANSRIAELIDMRPDLLARLSPLFGTQYVAASELESADLLSGGAKVLATQPNFRYRLIRAPAYMPRAYLARPVCVHDSDQAVHALLANKFDAPHKVLVECSEPLPSAPAGPLGSVALHQDSPERLQLSVYAQAPAVLVINDAFYSGWAATVDGHPTPILPANFLVRGVPVPAGKHSVVLTYRTPGLRAALWLSGVSLLVTLAVGLWDELRKRRRAKAVLEGEAPSAIDDSGHPGDKICRPDGTGMRRSST